MSDIRDINEDFANLISALPRSGGLTEAELQRLIEKLKDIYQRYQNFEDVG